MLLKMKAQPLKDAWLHHITRDEVFYRAINRKCSTIINVPRSTDNVTHRWVDVQSSVTPSGTVTDRPIRRGLHITTTISSVCVVVVVGGVLVLPVMPLSQPTRSHGGIKKQQMARDEGTTNVIFIVETWAVSQCRHLTGKGRGENQFV